MIVVILSQVFLSNENSIFAWYTNFMITHFFFWKTDVRLAVGWQVMAFNDLELHIESLLLWIPRINSFRWVHSVCCICPWVFVVGLLTRGTLFDQLTERGVEFALDICGWESYWMKQGCTHAQIVLWWRCCFTRVRMSLGIGSLLWLMTTAFISSRRYTNVWACHQFTHPNWGNFLTSLRGNLTELSVLGVENFLVYLTLPLHSVYKHPPYSALISQIMNWIISYLLHRRAPWLS